jgi:hypothetical protein
LGTSATLLCLHVLSQISEIKMRNILNLVMLLKLAILIQISSVPCERGFLLKIEFILSRLRTSMSNKTLNDRMMNSENGPHINSLGKLPKSGNGCSRERYTSHMFNFVTYIVIIMLMLTSAKNK